MDLELRDQVSFIPEWLSAYHRHVVVGMEHIPKRGKCLLVCNHSFATYDIVLLAAKIRKDRGRAVKGLMDRWFFKFKPIGDVFRALGGVRGDHSAALDLLAGNDVVCVAPGGMREAIRPSTQKYQIVWGRRKGFAKLAINAQAPVVLAACPRADDLYDILPTPLLSHFFYENFKLPFAILRGFGLTPIPKPVQLVHLLSEPIRPPKLAKNRQPTQEMVDRFHAKLVKRMRELMDEALAYETKGP